MFRLLCALLLPIAVTCKQQTQREPACPVEIRPKAVLSRMHLNESIIIKLRMEIIICYRPNGDTYLIFQATSVNINNKNLMFRGLDKYKTYHMFYTNCTLLIVHYPSEEEFVHDLRAHYWRYPEPRCVFICNHLLSKCEVFRWTCNRQHIREYRVFFPSLIKEMFSPVNSSDQDSEIISGNMGSLKQTRNQSYDSVTAYNDESTILWQYYVFSGFILLVIIVVIIYTDG